KRRPHGDHDLEPLSHRGERCRRGPRIERRRVDSLDVVEQQLGNERDVVADLLTPLRQASHIVPRRLHSLLFDVSQPAAEDGEPVAVFHTTWIVERGSWIADSTSSVGSNTGATRSASM